MSCIVVRASSEADLPAIQAIYAYEVLNGLASFEEIPPSLEEMTARRAALLDKGYPYLVAEKDGVVVGYAYAGPYRPRSAYRFSVENSIYINQDCRGQGVGSALMRELIVRSKAAGFKQMIAVIGNSENQGSIALHRRHGFADVGTFRAIGFKFDRWVDSVLMQLDLT